MTHPYTLLTLSLAPLVALACSSSDFDEDFALGAAVAGFQVDMGCPTLAPEVCEDRNSDWYAFVTSTVTQGRSSNFLSADPVSLSPGFYELYEADLDRMQAMGLTHFRFSVEWSRIFPSSTVGITEHAALKAIASQQGLDYYRALLGAMKARNIKPLVTLHHYTMPQWMHDAVGCNVDLNGCSPRGWLEPHMVDEIAKYAGFVARELGPEVDSWVTQNEPFAVLLPGYLQPSETRTNPPSTSLRFEEARTVLFAMIEAHAAMSDAIKANDSADADGDGQAAEVGLVYNVTPIHPQDPERALDQRAARNIDYLFNGLFLDAILLGVLDDDLDGEGQTQARLQNKTDFLGVNYYTRAVLSGENDSLFPDFSPLATFDPLSLQQGAVYPQGMYEVLMKVHEEYPGVPMVVSENGVDVGLYPQTDRFLVEHMQQMARAMKDGADVRGYYYWSLIDNYEWNHGLNMRFGMFEVDVQDPMKPRTARPIVDVYQQIIEARGITSSLKAQFDLP